MFGPLETKDLAQIAITVVGLAVIFLYFNRRLSAMTSLMHQHENMITSNNTEQHDSKFEAFGEILHALNDRISNLEMANHALAQQLDVLKHQKNTVSVVPEDRSPPRPRKQQPVPVHQVTEPKTQPVQSQPVQSQPVQSQPMQSQPVQSQPVQSQPTKPAATSAETAELDNATMDALLSEELEDLVEEDDEESGLKKEQ